LSDTYDSEKRQARQFSSGVPPPGKPCGSSVWKSRRRNCRLTKSSRPRYHLAKSAVSWSHLALLGHCWRRSPIRGLGASS